MFTRILVAIDSDEIADTVVAAAGGLAGPLNAQVALLHVVDAADASHPSPPPSQRDGEYRRSPPRRIWS